MDRATLFGIKTRVKVLIDAKKAQREQMARAGAARRKRPLASSHPLLSPITDFHHEDGFYVRNLDAGTELDITLENHADFAQAFAALTARDQSAIASFA